MKNNVKDMYNPDSLPKASGSLPYRKILMEKKMFDLLKYRASWLVVALILIGSTFNFVHAQTSPKPFLPKIDVAAAPSPTPLIKKTASVSPVMPDTVNPAEMAIPGYSGVLVETLDGKIVKDSYSTSAFNPASNVKIATSYAVLKTFGPDYRFPTNVFTDGAIDQTTGTLNGNLYVSGRDPIFTFEHAVAIADALNRAGIRTVTGDLIVTSSFIMAQSNSPLASANNLTATLNSGRRSAAATRAWQAYLTSSAKPQSYPSVSIGGKTYVDLVPSNAKLLFSHESAPLKEIVKVTMCYSNNFLAEKLGDMLGGAYAVSRIVQLNAGVPPEQFILQTSNGLGINRVTPQAMMKLLRTFRAELAKYKMTFADVMPIAGVDPGTLQRRFNTFADSGSVVGKTGTLGQTDGGASALSGEFQTRQGRFLFVIFNQRGTATRFRNFQNSFVTSLQNQYGGAAPLGYASQSLGLRLANTRITYPDTRARRN
ncbi:MAG: D-alanyl-D-alanine carboxypeptidase [Pyrinomonadaceae bacterium]